MRSNDKVKKTVMVLGSPRSGTSMTAGILEILGVDMGYVRKPDFQNPTGYFEDKQLLKLCTQIMEESDPNADGFNPPPKNDVLKNGEIFRNKIKKLIEQKISISDSNIWGFKVTLTAFMVELFIPYLKNPHFIIVERNPVDAAKSAVEYTEKKSIYEGLKFKQALKVINRYNKDIHEFLFNNPDFPHIVVDYDDMIVDPIRESKRISNFLSISISSDKKEKILNFVRPRERMKQLKKMNKLGEFALSIKGCIKRTMLKLYRFWKIHAGYR